MNAVGTRLGNRIHHRSAEFSVLSIKAVGDKAELLDRIEIGNQARTEVAPLADVSAIHKECVGGLALAVHGDVAGVQAAGYRAVLLDGLSSGGSNARLEAE